MAMLTRDMILQASDLPSEVVQVPEWGGDVYVRCMSGYERDRFEIAMAASGGNLVNVRARLAAATVCDETGDLLFSPEDIEALGSTSGAALDRVFDAARRLNRLNEADVEALQKN